MARIDPRFRAFAHHALTAYGIGQWRDYKPAAHHRLIGKKLKKVMAGEIKRLMIFMPPRHGKSMLASEFFPAWYLGHHPDRQVIFATYAQQAANTFGRKVRNQLSGPIHQGIFPGCRISTDSTAANHFSTRQRGAYFAVGIGGPITGRGAHLLLIDDPIKNRKDADSPVMRKTLEDWYTSTAYTRLQPGGAVILIQTRWHADDLAARLLKEHGHEGWEILNLPAVAEAGDQLERPEGTALWPEAYPLPDLERIKKTVGTMDWSALYQQRPVPAEGGIIKLAWFKRYRTAPARFTRIVQSWDTAFKPGQLNDPSVCLTWGEVTNGDLFLLDVQRRRLEYPDLKRTARSLADKWRPMAILVEDKGSGQSLVQDMRRESRWPVIAIDPEGDKTTRLSVVSPYIEAGRVHLPESAPWLADYETELTLFPAAAHDDQADATSQFLGWIATHPGDAKPVSKGTRALTGGLKGYPT